MAAGAACYPLCFDATSTVMPCTKSVKYADVNLRIVPSKRLSQASLQQVWGLQRRMRLFNWRGRIKDRLLALLR